MGECKLDHSLEDVTQKLKDQSSFLPNEVVQEWHTFLEKNLTQETLNVSFHLLKKYDLATDLEKKEREQQMEHLFGAD
ncbi:group-specific protein [Salipaludibacillus neizhouensis]|uniref:Group-specific protein n=1 Tax=Salipaludibacillus neizhouensis TaxID=885475 RepID=A0A3A9K8F3_9BACI|nr:group-specific protein [Salipaludibacillus neizhouensis]RKL69274.1 group-specific protein [Salipaludibacillus neizhouensis]